MYRFFNLGDSNKSIIGIGEKGLGTKTYFKSERIALVRQTKQNKAYKVNVNYCSHFGPYHKATNINGEYVSFQI